MRYDRAEDATLLLASGRGAAAAFAVFYRRWLPAVTSYHLRHTNSRELAFDLTAETFAAAAESCVRFDPALGSAAGWLFEIAEHKLIDSVRRRRVESSARERAAWEPLAVYDADLERVDELASQVTAERLDCLLEQLPRDQRHAVRARILDERAYSEIAAELECSVAVVRQRVHRGLAALRGRFKDIA